MVDGGITATAGAPARSPVKEDLAPLLFPTQNEALPALSLLTGRNSTSRPQGVLSDSYVVAAGRFDAAGEAEFASNGLVARRLEQSKQLLYLVSGRWFDPDGTYIVKGNAVVGLKSRATYSFASVSASDPELAELLEQAGYSTRSGIVLRVTRTDNRPVDTGFQGFTLEISRY